MLKIFIIVLLLAPCLDAGTVKTFEGAKIDKDSAAELDVYFTQGKRFDPYSIEVWVISIDSLRLYDMVASGKDFIKELNDSLQQQGFTMMFDSNAARSLRKLYLPPTEHIVTVQGYLQYNLKPSREFNRTNPIELKFTPLPGHRYEIGAKTDTKHWAFWISDKKTKEVVAATE